MSFTFPSRARPAPPTSSPSTTSATHPGPFPPPPQHARPLPAFGNPNHFPNPPSHYFPSAKGGTAQGRRRPGTDDDGPFPSSPSPPPAEVALNKGKSALPRKGSGVGAARREEWNAAAALLEELDEESDELEDGMQVDGEEQDHEQEQEQEQEQDDELDLNAPGARARQKELQEKVGAKGEPAKKRSRTLTTPHQTRVLNALLAKTRFPSTETRQQVGQEIGMSARRVQIWFQNRRQSQKRARDREATDGYDDDRSSVHSAHSSHSHHYSSRPFPLTQRTTHGSFPSHAHAAAVYGGAHSYASPYPLPAHSQTHSYPLSTHASPFLRTDPYARYPPPGERRAGQQLPSLMSVLNRSNANVADEFSRLDIREDPSSPLANHPASLPPLRLALGGEYSPPPRRGEADQALMAPILPQPLQGEEKVSLAPMRLPPLKGEFGADVQEEWERYNKMDGPHGGERLLGMEGRRVA